MKKYDSLKPQYVVENLGKGKTVLCCDFGSNKIINCFELTIGSVLKLVNSPDCIFFIVSIVEEKKEEK